MFEIGDIIHFTTFNGDREAVIVKVLPKENYLCKLNNDKYVIVGENSIKF